MSVAYPFVPYICESAVIEHPVDRVWDMIQLINFPKFHPDINFAEVVKYPDADGEVIRWKTVEEDHEIELQYTAKDYVNHTYTYTCISSKNPTAYTATGSTVRCIPITWGKHKGHTFTQYTGEYSNDAGTEGIEHARDTRHEILDELAKALDKKYAP